MAAAEEKKVKLEGNWLEFPTVKGGWGALDVRGLRESPHMKQEDTTSNVRLGLGNDYYFTTPEVARTILSELRVHSSKKAGLL